MSVSYDVFTADFLDKIKDYELLSVPFPDNQAIVDGYARRACSRFNKICAYDLVTKDESDESGRTLAADIPETDLDEIVDIVSEGMTVQWLKPYFYQSDNYINLLNTTDFYAYSPAELLYRITSAYKTSKRDFNTMMREYSYRHADLTDLHS